MDVDSNHVNGPAPDISSGPADSLSDNIKPEEAVPEESTEHTEETAMLDEEQIQPESESDEEATSENNTYLQQLQKSHVTGLRGADAKRVTSPVVAPHSSEKAPFSCLSSYDTVIEETVPLIAMYRSFSRQSGTLQPLNRYSWTTTSPFLLDAEKSSWQPLSAPSTLLVDQSLPDTTIEWSRLSRQIDTPSMTTVIDPLNFNSLGAEPGTVLIHWQSVSKPAKGRKPKPRNIIPEPPAPRPVVEAAPEPEPAVPSSRQPPRDAKKRARELVREEDFLEMEPEAPPKRRKTTTQIQHKPSDFIIRIPIALALKYLQEEQTRQIASQSRPDEHDAAGLLSSFLNHEASSSPLHPNASI